MSRKVKGMSEHVTVYEAARILGMHHVTVRRFISEGKLAAYRVGNRHIRIPLDAIEKILVRIPTAAER